MEKPVVVGTIFVLFCVWSYRMHCLSIGDMNNIIWSPCCDTALFFTFLFSMSFIGFGDIRKKDRDRHRLTCEIRDKLIEKNLELLEENANLREQLRQERKAREEKKSVSFSSSCLKLVRKHKDQGKIKPDQVKVETKQT